MEEFLGRRIQVDTAETSPRPLRFKLGGQVHDVADVLQERVDNRDHTIFSLSSLRAPSAMSNVAVHGRFQAPLSAPVCPPEMMRVIGIAMFYRMQRGKGSQ